MAASTRAPAAAERLPAPVPRLRPRSGHPTLLAAGLALASASAAFASGATGIAQAARLELLLVVIALGAVASAAAGGGVHWRMCRPAAIGLGLLVALAAWIALSLLWSITPDRSWVEANRAIAYALVVALALAVGAGDRRAIERVSLLLLAGIGLVAVHAFLTKVLPGATVLGLGQPATPSRLRGPLDDPNALALLCALGVPIAVRLACDPTRRRRGRALALAVGLLLLVVIGLTYSRGGLVAVGVGALVLTALGGWRLRGLGVLAALAVAAAPVLAVAFSLAGTTEAGAAQAARERDGRWLLLAFLVALVLLLAGALAASRTERRVAFRVPRRALLRGAGLLVALAVVAVVAVGAGSEGGLSGAISDRAAAFGDPVTEDESDPGRLLTTTSGNRWGWWEEAAGAWSDRPVAGWGAGSFRATHLRYRQDELTVAEAHSVPLQLLVETGLVGLLLFAAAIGALLVAAVARVRGLPDGRERDLAVAGLAAVAAWLIHGLHDPDWTIPGVTLPALILLGVLAGGRLPDARRPDRRPGGPASPALVVVAAALVLSVVAASAVLPAWADDKASDARATARAGGDETTLSGAAADADLAARLDPVAVRPLLVGAAIARRRGRLLESRALGLEAVGRQPDSSEAWRGLSASAAALADREGAERAALRALALDPMSPRTRRAARAAVAGRTPAGSSATAVGTPLAPAPVPAAPLPPEPVPPDPAGATGATGATGAPGG